MGKPSRFKCCGITFLVLGTLLLVLSIAMPFVITALIPGMIKNKAILSTDNENLWRGIPGEHNILITRNNYFYNCTNIDDVIYKGSKPIVEEFGPVYYREHDTYDGPLDWNPSVDIPGQPEIKSAGV